MNRQLILFCFVLLGGMLSAQSAEMADQFREDGKIWVVIGVIGIIFVSLVAFLVYLERRIKRMEDRINTDKHT